jgi:hypothetical protein
MKKIIIIAMTLSVMNINAQGTTRNTIQTESVSNSKFEVIQRIQEEDTSYFVLVSFQNMKYTTLIDTEIILFDKQIDYIDFVDAIKEVGKKPTDSDYEYVTTNGSRVFTSKYGVVIYSKQGKYTMLNRKHIIKKYDSVKTMTKYLK